MKIHWFCFCVSCTTDKITKSSKNDFEPELCRTRVFSENNIVFSEVFTKKYIIFIFSWAVCTGSMIILAISPIIFLRFKNGFSTRIWKTHVFLTYIIDIGSLQGWVGLFRLRLYGSGKNKVFWCLHGFIKFTCLGKKN